MWVPGQDQKTRWPESPGGSAPLAGSSMFLFARLSCCPLGICLISFCFSVLLSQPLLPPLPAVAPWCSWFLSQRLITRFPEGSSGEGRVRRSQENVPHLPACPSFLGLQFSRAGQDLADEPHQRDPTFQCQARLTSSKQPWPHIIADSGEPRLSCNWRSRTAKHKTAKGACCRRVMCHFSWQR